MRLEILAVLGLVAGSCSAQNFYGYRYRRDYNGTSSTTNSTSSSTSTSLSSSSDTSSSSSSSSKSSISSSISGSSSSSKSSVSSSSSASSGSSTSSLAASYGNNSTLSNVAPSPVGPATASANSTSQLSVSSTASTANASTSSYTKTSYAYAPSGYTPSGYPSGNATSKTGPTGTGSSGRTKTTVPPNGTCGTATLNVLDASLDWWYTSTLYDIVSIYRATYNRNVSTEGWTLIANPTPFDVTSALETDACTSTPVFVTGLNITTYDYSCGPASTPAAAATTILTQTAYQQPNATTGNGAIPNVIITPPPATISIPKDGGYAQGTPFVYFSAYEIITKSVITYSNGSVGCGGGETNTYPMATPFSFEYTGADPDGLQEVNAGVTGDVNPAFLGVVNASNAVAGSWVAAPTVALVVQKVVAKEQVFAAAQITATQLETPSATLPSGFTSGSADTGGFTAPTGFTGHLESSETSLATNPTSTAGGSGSGSSGSGSSGSGSGSGSSGSGSGSGSGSSGSGSGSGSSGSGSSGSGSSGSGSGSGSGSSGSGSGSGSNGSGSGSGSSGSGSGGSGSGSGSSGSGSSGNGGAGGLISAIGSLSEVQPSPTNAAQVLSDAEQTFPASIQNPTAAAIVSGINGGSSSSGSGSGSSGSGSGGSSGSGSSGGASAPVIVVGGSTVTGNSATEFSLGPSATLTPGGTAVVAGTTLSLGSGSSGNTIVVNGQTQTFSSVAVTPAPALTIGGQTITANSASAFVIGGQTLTPGGVVTAGGSTISLAQGATAVVINGQTSALSNPAITPAPIITLNGQTFTASGASSEFVIDGQTLTPGGQITAEGSTISLAQGATAVVINGQTSVLSNPAGITPAPVLTLNGQTFTANGASDFVIDGQTLTPGGVITAEGSTISLAQGGTAVVINGVTSQLSNPTITAAPALTVGGQTYSLISGSEYIIDGQTLTPGGVITEDGTTISLGAGASFAVVNGVTENLSPSITGAPVLSVGGQTFTAINNGGTFIIDGETLTPGGIETVTIGGHVYILSLAPGASTVEIEEEGPNGQITGTIYESIARATVTLTAGAGAGPSSPSQTIQPALQGGASSTKVHLSSMLGSVFVAFSTLALAIWL